MGEGEQHAVIRRAGASRAAEWRVSAAAPTIVVAVGLAVAVALLAAVALPAAALVVSARAEAEAPVVSVRAEPVAAGGGQEPGSAVALEGGPIPVRASPRLAELARSLVNDPAAWAPMPGIGGPDAWFERPPTLWIVEDLSTVPGGGPGERQEEWAAGFADFERNLVAVRAGGEGPGRLSSLRQTVRHELAHLALHRATGGAAPRWLHEGYAQLVAGGWDWRQAWRLRFALVDEEDVLRELALRFPRDEQSARAAYLLSYTAVQELARGPEGAALGSLFARLREGATMDEAMRDVYATTLDQFEERWRESVKDRYGWLYLLSRASLFWVALTLALLLLGWRRWRYDRRRWEEYRRQEEREEAFLAWWLGGREVPPEVESEEEVR